MTNDQGVLMSDVSSSTRRLFGALLLLGLVGCGSREERPKTWTAGGRVVTQGTVPSLTGGTVEFLFPNQPSRNARGEIAADGSFTLFTLHGNARLPGAAEGEYTVRVSSRMADDQSMQSYTLGTYKVEPRDGNDFTLTVKGTSP
jgi:hypothetical protein